MKLIAAWAILASLACVMAGQASLIVQFKDGKSYTSPKLECGLQTNLPKYWDSPPAAVTYRGPSRDADLPDYMTQYDFGSASFVIYYSYDGLIPKVTVVAPGRLGNTSGIKSATFAGVDIKVI